MKKLILTATPVADKNQCGCGSLKVRDRTGLMLCARNPHCTGQPVPELKGVEIMTEKGYVHLGK